MKLIQTQEQRQLQQQRLSAQQMLQVRLLEMPLTELEESVNAELYDNPALESDSEAMADGQDLTADDRGFDEGDNRDDDFEIENEREERRDALDMALEGLGRDDEMPEANNRQYSTNCQDYEEIVYGDTVSFYDKLHEQLMELDLTEREKNIMEYIIGSLDDDGLLRKDLDSIYDELAIYHHIDCTEAELNQLLKMIQEFDPPGIGAQSLQECLLIQVDRKLEQQNEKNRTSDKTAAQSLDNTEEWKMRLVRVILSDYFEAFTKKHWDKIQLSLRLSDYQIEAVQQEIKKLNPKPGSSLGETQGRNMQQITPDFIIDTADDGSISFSMNQGNIPELHISQSFVDMMETYRDNKQGMNRQAKEALLYVKEKMEKAQGFIEAVKQRRHTLYVTMKAIIEWQRKFFQDGDESDLRPMILKDIADKTGLDISTISRVSNIKYAQTKWGTYPLRFFFSDGYTTESGEELSTRKIKLALKELIDKEDKKNPMSDEMLTKRMKEQGYSIARRTVAKYREQMGIPVARMRK